MPVNYIGYLDEDSHADMHCAGAIFSVRKFSGYQCDVDPFLDTYQTTTGVDVITAATAVQLSAGDTLFLVSTAALWFGDTMKISLFNANIMRDAGLEVCTSAMDPIGNSALVTKIRDSTFHSTDMETFSASVRTSLTLMTSYRPC